MVAYPCVAMARPLESPPRNQAHLRILRDMPPGTHAGIPVAVLEVFVNILHRKSYHELEPAHYRHYPTIKSVTSPDY